MKALRGAVCVIAVLACRDATGSSGSDVNGQSEAASRMAGVLRKLVLFEESYFADSVDYTSDLSFPVPGLHGTNGFEVPTGLRLTLEYVTGGGWRGTVVDDASRVRCAIYIGEGPPVIEDAAEGEPLCEAF